MNYNSFSLNQSICVCLCVRGNGANSQSQENKIPTGRLAKQHSEPKTRMEKNDTDAKNKVYKAISIEMVSVENEIFPLRKYNKFHLLFCWCMYVCIHVLLRVSCAFHCFIFPKRNELLNWYVRRSIFFIRA